MGQQPLPRQGLRIIALEGHNSINYIPFLTGTAPVVEVRDETDRPIEGAGITFTIIPGPTGAGATFEGGQSKLTTLTDFRGQAGSQPYTINNRPGQFTVEVTAAHQGRSARLVLTQTNSIDRLPAELGGPKRSKKKMWILVTVAAAAGAGLGVYFGTRSSNTPISVSLGSVGVGGPR